MTSAPRVEVVVLASQCRKRENTQGAVCGGFKLEEKTGHVVVDAEDALVAALKVKIQAPAALITYARQQNKRGDARHPMGRRDSDSS